MHSAPRAESSAVLEDAASELLARSLLSQLRALCDVEDGPATSCSVAQRQRAGVAAWTQVLSVLRSQRGWDWAGMAYVRVREDGVDGLV